MNPHDLMSFCWPITSALVGVYVAVAVIRRFAWGATS